MSSPAAEPDVAAASSPPASIKLSRFLLWVAVITPFFYSTQKTAAEVATGGFGAVDIVRGAGPAAFWFLSIIVSATLRAGFGVLEWALTAFGVLILLSSLLPENPSPQGTVLKAGSMVFVLLALGRLSRMYARPSEFVVALAGFVHVVLLAGAVQLVLFQHSVYAPTAGSLDTVPRLNLIVPSVSANPLGFLGVGGILSCVLGVAPRRLPFRGIIRISLMGLYAYEIYLTRTRSALVVGLIVMAVALLLRLRRRPLVTLLTFSLALLAAATLIPSFMPAIHAFLQRGQDLQQLDTLTGRTVIWDQAIQTWRLHPTLGLGYYTGHRLGIQGLSQSQSNIDNTWLETLVDVGVLGLVPLAVFFLVGLTRLVRRSELRHDIKLWAIGVAAYGLVISFINPSIQSPSATQVLLSGLLLSVGPRLKRREDPFAARLREAGAPTTSSLDPASAPTAAR